MVHLKISLQASVAGAGRETEVQSGLGSSKTLGAIRLDFM